MTTTPNDTPPNRKPFRFPWRVLCTILVLLVLLLVLFRSCTDRGRVSMAGDADSLRAARVADSLRRLDSLAALESLSSLDSLQADSAARADSLAARDSAAIADSLRRLDSLARLRHRLDTSTTGRGTHSGPPTGSSSLSRLDSLRRATGDSVPPGFLADPAPGVHPAPIDVAVIVMEPKGVPLCGSRPDSLHLCRNLIRISKATRLWVSAEDSVGNRAEPREMRWEIDPDASRCGIRRALVPQDDGREICMDAYEYPNDPSMLPRTSVNWEQASAICAQAGRRLCSAEELRGACSGPESSAYPYGSVYTVGYCRVLERKLGRGVSTPGCRSWWGAYNLVGNAWEWTSTPSGTTYLTSGGTYEGGPDVKCGRTSRSFFRQNSYEAVGFRCCEDLPKR